MDSMATSCHNALECRFMPWGFIQPRLRVTIEATGESGRGLYSGTMARAELFPARRNGIQPYVGRVRGISTHSIV